MLGLALGVFGGAAFGAAVLALLARARGGVQSAAVTEFGAIAAAMTDVATASRAQSESMHRLAIMTAESVRLASGAYVFELRDRFDAALGPSVVGVAHAELCAGSELGPIHALAFHAGDAIRGAVRMTINQSIVRRIVTARWARVPQHCSVLPTTFASPAGAPTGTEGWELPSDVSMFVDFAFDLDAGGLPVGPFETNGRLELELTNTRPEGVVSRIGIDVRISAVVVPDDDGVGLDVPAVEAVVGDEQRTYLLEKSADLILELPLLRERS